MESKRKNIKTMEFETFAKIIQGELLIDECDTFVEEYFEKSSQEFEDEMNGLII